MKWWDQSFKSAFPLSSFTFIKRLFSSSSLSAIRVVSPAYLRSLIFLPAILIWACVPSSPAFHVMYSAYKLNRVTIYSLNILLSQLVNWLTCKNTFIIRGHYLFNVLTGLLFTNPSEKDLRLSRVNCSAWWVIGTAGAQWVLGAGLT